jgi:hypothetical protein
MEELSPPETKASDTSHGGHDLPFEDLDYMDLDGLSEEEIQQLLEDRMDGSPLEGIADHVMGDIMSRHVGPSTPMEQFQAFRSAITWSESFVVSLLLFQFTMCIICFWVSRKSRGLAPRLFVMAFIAVVVRSAETLNGIGARNWARFATQNYFDKRGIFVGIMLCGPLLLDSFVMLLCFLYEASQLLVQVKRGELRRNKKGENDPKAKKTD